MCLSFFTIMFDMKPVVETYTDHRHTYIHSYYIAYKNTKGTINMVFGDTDQMAEVSDIKWIGEDELRFVDTSTHLTKIVKRVFRAFAGNYTTGH